MYNRPMPAAETSVQAEGQKASLCNRLRFDGDTNAPKKEERHIGNYSGYHCSYLIYLAERLINLIPGTSIYRRRAKNLYSPGVPVGRHISRRGQYHAFNPELRPTEPKGREFKVSAWESRWSSSVATGSKQQQRRQN
ncbi:hypothetical protein PGQ11_013180 [Apiospora arundinis]|uniref:Uncharacterized protein n=1 Tax=Apiospora arundinis TaxID=335852 RepID=A0ABR2I5H5_9PEZI